MLPGDTGSIPAKGVNVEASLARKAIIGSLNLPGGTILKVVP